GPVPDRRRGRRLVEHHFPAADEPAVAARLRRAAAREGSAPAARGICGVRGAHQCVLPGPTENGMRRPRFRFAAAPLLVLLAGCQSGRHPPMPTVDHVDLPRFVGDWYVIANIPTWLERGAHNAVENYALADDGTIATTFTFRAGSFDGPLKTY